MAIREILRRGKKGYDVQVAVRHPQTRQRFFLRGKATTKWEAEKLEHSLLEKLQKKVSGKEMPTWNELVVGYEQACLINKAASTRYNELSLLSSHAAPSLHSKLIDQINESDIRTILQNVDPERSISLKHNIRKVISNIFSYAIERRLIQINPCSRIKLEKMPEPSLNILTDTQIRIFLQKAEESGTEWFPVWACGIYTGMRSGELITLRWRHLEHSEGKPIIRIQESWTKKGYDRPYTKNRMVRSVSINPELQRIFDNLRAANPDKCGPEDFVLPQIPTWKQGDAAKDLRAFLRGCGLPVIRFHDLRAIFISQLLLKGVTPTVVMRMVGHKDLKTMMRYCRHVGSDVIGQTDVLSFR